jgi:hypothetical protein
VNRLINAITLALPIRNPTQTRARQQPNTPRDDRCLITDNIPKQVARNHDAVQRARVLDHEHGCAVNQLVVELELRELLLKHLGDNLPPQPAGRQHVRLVQTPHLGRRVLGQREEPRQARDPLDLGARVGLGVEREARTVVLLALAKVDAARQLPDDDEVGAAADLGLERGRVDEGVGGEAAGAQVAVGAELLAQLEDALLRADGGRGTPFWAADGAEEDGIGGLGGGEGLVGEGGVVGFDGGLTEEGD